MKTNFQKQYNGLLYLYQKEKEKNKELEQVLEEWVNGERIYFNHISKDKIKAKIEELDGMCEIGDIEREIYNRAEYATEVLQELLEE